MEDHHRKTAKEAMGAGRLKLMPKLHSVKGGVFFVVLAGRQSIHETYKSE